MLSDGQLSVALLGALIGASAVLLLAIRRTEYLLMASILALLFNQGFSLAGVELQPAKVLVLLVAVVGIIKGELRVPVRLMLPAVALFGAGVLSIAWNDRFTSPAALGELGRWAYYLFIAVPVGYTYLRRESLRYVVVLGLVLSVVGVRQYLVQSDVYGVFVLGFFKNALGLVVDMTLPICLYLAFSEIKRWRMLAMVSVIGQMVLLAVLGSRASLLFGLVNVVIALILMRRWRVVAALPIGALSLTGIAGGSGLLGTYAGEASIILDDIKRYGVAWLWYEPVNSTFDSTTGLYTSLWTRMAMLTTGYRMFTDNPLLGNGFGSYYFEFGSFMTSLHPHNFLILFLAEIGLVGTLAMLWYLWSGIRVAVKALANAESGHFRLGHAILMSLLTYLIHGLVDNIWLGVSAILFWLIFGAALVSPRVAPAAGTDVRA